jgi:hypothetical protein
MVLLAGAVLLSALVEAQDHPGRKFYPDDPLLQDDDRLPVPEKPAEIELSDLYDRFGHIFATPGSGGGEAQNVNTLDEVPDSSWFTNRIGVRKMSLEEVVRGPDRGSGPDPEKPWTVFRSKSQGLTPGFEIIDDRGDRYVIKLDPVSVPELSSAAEVIATAIFHNLGYNVAENYIVRVKPENLVIRPGTMVRDRFGDQVLLTDVRFRRLLRRVPRLPDGRIRVTASKYIPGAPIGPFRYHETRSDDPNDVIPHEHRRELRGLRAFAAWTNHDDTRAHNTQDSWVEEDGRRYVKHFLLDFGSTFGSGSVDLQLPNLSFHYWLELDLVKKNARSFGFNTPFYRRVKWPHFPEYESVGRWESQSFDCDGWRNDYPNPAFVRMTDRDSFWAAKILMRFTPEELLAIVKKGQLSDPEQERYFHQVLVERQRKCGREYLNRSNPLDEFRLNEGRLEFVNLAERYGFAAAATRYEVTWHLFDNADGTRLPLKGPFLQTERSLALPIRDYLLGKENLLLQAEIRSLHPDHPPWKKAVRVYLRPREARFDIVGIERESSEEAMAPGPAGGEGARSGEDNP